jgi:hypothetical protein
MRLVSFDLGSDPVAAGGAVNDRIEDLQLAVALLGAAASAAEQEIAGSARAATRKLLRACRAFETAVAEPVRPTGAAEAGWA